MAERYYRLPLNTYRLATVRNVTDRQKRGYTISANVGIAYGRLKMKISFKQNE